MNSLRRQLTRRLLAVFALLLGVALLALYSVIWLELTRAFDSALESRALGVSALVEQEGGGLQMDFSEKLMRSFAADGSRYYFEIRNRSGALVARSPSLQGRELGLPRAPATERPVFWNLSLPNGRPGRAVIFTFQPMPSGELATKAVPVQLVVAMDRENLDETLGGLLAMVAGCGAVLLGAVFLVVPRVLRRGLVPLDRLGEQAAAIDAGSLAVRFPTTSLPAELQPITGRLNDLLARLEAAFERERRYSADLAHELRTPLAELRSLAECALKWPEAREPGTDRDVLASALQMEALVTRLLTLARGERGQLAVGCEPVDVAATVAAAWQPFAARAAERRLAVEITGPAVRVPADPVLLRSILGNLFDNAVDYSPPGGTISITVEAGGGVWVANPSGALTPEDVARLFERFWRKETARTGGEHVGLGLNLARTFATAMDWKLEVKLDSGRLAFHLAPVPR